VLNDPFHPVSSSHRVELAGVDPARVQLAALTGDLLALVEDGSLRVLDGPSVARPRDRLVLELRWTPGAMQLSPSGALALLVSPQRDRAAVIDLRTGGQLLELGGPAARPASIAATFAATPAGEVLVLSRERFVLEAMALPSGTALFRVQCHIPQPFVFDSLHAMLDGDTIVAVGHGESESKDSLITISLRALAADRAWLARELVHRQRPSDYAYRLAAGAWERDGMVVFRDPEDDEEPDEDTPPTGRDVEGLRGFYTRRLADATLVDRIAIDAPIASGAELFATGDVILAGGAGQLLLFSRRAQGAATVLDASVYAIDRNARRILTLQANGEISLHQLGNRGASA
jgi:hypothetical protein